MKVELKQKILNFEGKPVNDFDSRTLEVFSKAAVDAAKNIMTDEQMSEFIKALDKETMKNELTLGQVCRNVLAGGAGNEKLKADKKLECFSVGLKCVGDTADLTDKERVLIVSLVDEAKYSPLVYGRVSQLLESSSEASQDEPDEEG